MCQASFPSNLSNHATFKPCQDYNSQGLKTGFTQLLIIPHLSPPQDSKVVGEANCQANLRLPPLRDGRHNRLFSAALSLRVDRDANTMRPGDGCLVMDGGRDGFLAPQVA